MKIRKRDKTWSFSRRHMMHVLGLDGTGALWPVRIGGILRLSRGGVWRTVT